MTSPDLGNGDDSFIWNPGDGSDTVLGQTGTDTMLFNGSGVDEVISVVANGPGRAGGPQCRRHRDGPQQR